MTVTRIPGCKRSPELCIDDGGKNRLPVVFVHSLGGTFSQWSTQLVELRKSRRALALDLRGHGCSGIPEDGDFSIASLSEDVGSAVDHLNIDRYILVGHSLGGSVALANAGAHPNRVAGLLLVDPSGDARQVPKEQMRPFLAALESDSYRPVLEEYYRGILENSQPAVRQKVLADLFATPPQAVIAAFRALTLFDPLPPLQSFSGPKLSVLTPYNDAPFSLHKIYPELPFVLVTGTSHWLHMDRPQEFNRILDDFLKDVERSQGSKVEGPIR